MKFSHPGSPLPVKAPLPVEIVWADLNAEFKNETDLIRSVKAIVADIIG